MNDIKSIIYEKNGSIEIAAFFSRIKEECGFATVDNTQGIGNAQPPTVDNIGSGDKWDNNTPKHKNTKKKKTNEEMVNPTDTLGNELLKSFNVNSYFEKTDEDEIKQKKPKKIKIKTLQDYINNL